jgi:hypothetical protein
MKNTSSIWPALSVLMLSLAGCSMGGISQSQPVLSPTQCADLGALRHGDPVTPERSRSELAALRKAGYDPGLRFDPHYPDDLQAAQRQVDLWYDAQCR